MKIQQLLHDKPAQRKLATRKKMNQTSLPAKTSPFHIESNGNLNVPLAHITSRIVDNNSSSQSSSKGTINNSTMNMGAEPSFKIGNATARFLTQQSSGMYLDRQNLIGTVQDQINELSQEQENQYSQEQSSKNHNSSGSFPILNATSNPGIAARLTVPTTKPQEKQLSHDEATGLTQPDVQKKVDTRLPLRT